MPHRSATHSILGIILAHITKKIKKKNKSFTQIAHLNIKSHIFLCILTIFVSACLTLQTKSPSICAKSQKRPAENRRVSKIERHDRYIVPSRLLFPASGKEENAFISYSAASAEATLTLTYLMKTKTLGLSSAPGLFSGTTPNSTVTVCPP